MCNKASNQLDTIGRTQKYVGFKEKEVLRTQTLIIAL